MTSIFSRGSWLPDRTPTWIDVVVALVAIFWLITEFDGRPLSWPWVAIGFLGLVLAVGPLANSSFGDAIGRWAQSMSGLAVLLTLLVLAAILLYGISILQIPDRIVHSFVTGLMSAIPILTAIHILVSGRIGDWQFVERLE